MKSPSVFLLLILLVLGATVPSSVVSQKRASGRQTAATNQQSTVEQEAGKFWTHYVASCGGSRYLRKAPGVFVELRGFRIRNANDPITEADRLNGVEAKGQSSFGATAHRFYSNSAWQPWHDGIPEDVSLINSVKFERVRGRWRFYGVGYFNDYAKPVTCSDIPGFRPTKLNEVPTNSVQINDTHVFPIQTFTFWDSNTKLTANKFPKSTTTFVNWRITYTETAFDYSLPPVESRWYKDGQEWSYDGAARFDNNGAGHIYAGKGWNEPGRWEIGTYTVKVYLRKQLIAQRSFEIVSDDSIAGTLRYDGVYYLKINGGIWFLRFQGDGTVNDLFAPHAGNMEFNDSLWYYMEGCLETKGKSADQLSHCYAVERPSMFNPNPPESKDFNGGIGAYQRNGSQIEFTLQPAFARTVSISFDGMVGPTSLMLNWKLGATGTGRFTFWRCPFSMNCW